VFGWFKKKQANEIKKLLFQNFTASEREIYVYKNDPAETARMVEAGFDRAQITLEGDETILARMRQISDETRRIGAIFDGHGSISIDDQRILLNLNRELRKLYDEGRISVYRRHNRPSFDATYKPTLGWEEYYASRGIGGQTA
jgi:hypothetical protein